MTDLEASERAVCRPVRTPERPAAIRRLTGHYRQPAHTEYFAAVLKDLAPEPEWFWAAFDEDEQIVAAVLIVPQSGRTGMMFVSTARNPAEASVTSRLVNEACQSIPRQRVTLAQALLPAGDGDLARILEGAQFTQLARLIYMQARVPRRPAAPPDPEPPITLEPWHPELRADFITALENSYHQTLDCPALQGLRDTGDVLNGHMGTGEFDPDLWTLVRYDGRPLGTMLLNQVPTAGCIELVYLGVAPALRGHGLGRLLMQRAMWQAASRRERHMMLAVDEANAPAVRLYRACKFVESTRKLAMIRDLR